MALDLNFVVETYEGSISDFLETANTFFEDHSELRGFTNVLELTKELLDDTHDYYQILIDGVLAGLAAVKLENEVITFNVFVVDPQFREVGIGDELFSSIIKNSKYTQAKSYESKVLPGDRHTKNFFETRKGKARLLIVNGDLPPRMS